MKKRPNLAVIMATYNDNEALTTCVESLNASTVLFDLYVVDDASKKPAFQFVPDAGNIYLTRTESNIGPAKARNLAIQQALAKGYEYIAIMDADDTVLPERFEKQIAFLAKNPDIAIACTWANVVDEKDGRVLFHLNYPETHEQILKALCYNSCFVHPSAMFRAEAMRALGGYDETFPVAQDYEIFFRASKSFRLANIPDYLVNYTWSSKSISATKRKRQLQARLRIQRTYFQPSNLHAWAGLAKTLVIMFIPRDMLSSLKTKLKGFSEKV